MTKAHNKSGTGSQKSETGNTKTTSANKQVTGTSSTSGITSQSNSPKPQSVPSIDIQTEKSKEKQGSKSRKPVVGGTAVQGAKSTQPKEITTSPRNRKPRVITARCAGACNTWALALMVEVLLILCVIRDRNALINANSSRRK